VVGGRRGNGGWSLPRQAPAQTPGPEIADVQTVNGSVVVTSIGANPRVLNQPAPRIRSGDRIETADGGRAALATAGGLSVRLDRATAAVFASADHLVLERGAVYVDSGPGASNAALQIETPLGVVRHTGTQFEVRVDAAEVRVGVREGSVAVDAPGGRVTSRAGEALVLSRGRAPERLAIAASGPEWDWVVGLAQPFQLEGATAQGFLQWVSREQGWRLEFEDASLRARVAGIVLHGSIDSLTPEEALAAVLPTCGLTSRRDGDRLIVSAGSRSWRRTPRRSRRAARRPRSRRPRASSRAPACKRSLSCA
jgi:ferric-dicitrate binding protein FerR (iron transport regulator)